MNEEHRPLLKKSKEVLEHLTKNSEKRRELYKYAKKISDERLKKLEKSE